MNLDELRERLTSLDKSLIRIIGERQSIVIPELDVASHINLGPSETFQFITAMGGFLGHPLPGSRQFSA